MVPELYFLVYILLCVRGVVNLTHGVEIDDNADWNVLCPYINELQDVFAAYNKLI